jgi:hypothetical protein
MTGAAVTTPLQIAMTCAVYRRGQRSSSAACDIGIIDAPAMPWRMRKPMICGRFIAIPHSIDATMNIAVEIRNTCLRPTLSESQPNSGVMIAVATI